MGNAKILESFREQINKYFVGKREVVDNVLCCFLAGGHVLLEDVPGVGKTTLARCFASLLGLSFGRIQFTPDTMPADVTGLTVYDMKSGEFSYRPGAVGCGQPPELRPRLSVLRSPGHGQDFGRPYPGPGHQLRKPSA